jgi:ribose 5-phosphate isomerase A
MTAVVDARKKAAGEAAVRGYVRSGMAVGLGTGSTAIWATRHVGALLAAGELRDIVAVATSRATHAEAVALGIPMLDEALPRRLDVTIDGADEVDPAWNLVKGGGGALLREKVVAQSSDCEVIVVDDSKLSPCLGTHFALPVEVLAFGWEAQAEFVASLGAKVVRRVGLDGAVFVTDEGNVILDCDFGPIEDLSAVATALEGRAGVMEHGLFLGMTKVLVVAGPNGVEEPRHG